MCVLSDVLEGRLIDAFRCERIPNNRPRGHAHRYGHRVRRGLVLALGLAFVLAALASASAATPRIAGTTLDGKRLALADLGGKPVVINVWSSW
jgi:hypothetical protein